MLAIIRLDYSVSASSSIRFANVFLIWIYWALKVGFYFAFRGATVARVRLYSTIFEVVVALLASLLERVSTYIVISAKHQGTDKSASLTNWVAKEWINLAVIIWLGLARRFITSRVWLAWFELAFFRAFNSFIFACRFETITAHMRRSFESKGTGSIDWIAIWSSQGTFVVDMNV